MANSKNIAIATSLAEKFSKAISVVLADYRGLTHKQSEDLHRAVKKVGGEFVIAKNSLLQIASQSSHYNLEPKTLVGPTAALFAFEDELAPLKELFKIIKTLSLPKVKFGFISGKKYSDLEVEVIAKLPGQDILRGQVVGRLNGPIYGLVYSLNYNLQKLVYVLSKINK